MATKKQALDDLVSDIDMEELASIYQSIAASHSKTVARNFVEEAVQGIYAREAETTMPQLVHGPDVFSVIAREAVLPR